MANMNQILQGLGLAQTGLGGIGQSLMALGGGDTSASEGMINRAQGMIAQAALDEARKEEEKRRKKQRNFDLLGTAATIGTSMIPGGGQIAAGLKAAVGPAISSLGPGYAPGERPELSIAEAIAAIQKEQAARETTPVEEEFRRRYPSPSNPRYPGPPKQKGIA